MSQNNSKPSIKLSNLLKKNQLRRTTTQKNNSRNVASRHSLKDVSFSMEISKLKEQFEQTNLQTEENLKQLQKENQKLSKKVILKSKISQEMLQSINEIVSFFYQRENDQKENFLQYQNYIIKTLHGIIIQKSLSLQNKPLPRKLQKFNRKTYCNLLSKNQRKIDSLTDFYELFNFDKFQQIKKQIQQKIKTQEFKGEVSLPPEELNIDFPEHSEFNIKGDSLMESFSNFNLNDILQEKKTLIAYQKSQPTFFEQIKNLAQFEENEKMSTKEVSQSLEYLKVFNKKFSHLIQNRYKDKEKIILAQYDNFVKENTELSKLIIYKEDQIKDFQKEMEKMQNNVHDKQQESEQLSLDMKEWEDSIKQVYQERDDIFAHIDEQQDKFDQIKNNFQQVNKEIIEGKEQTKNLKKQIKIDQKKIEKSQQNKIQIKEEINDLVIIQQNLKDELKQKEEELDDVIKIKNQNTLKINHQRSVIQRRQSQMNLIQKDIENLKLELEDAVKLYLEKEQIEQKNEFLNIKLIDKIEKLKLQKLKDFNEDKLQEHLSQYRIQLTNIKQLMPKNLDLKFIDQNMEKLKQKFMELFQLIKNTKQDSIDINTIIKKIDSNKFEIKQIQDQLLKQNLQLNILKQEYNQQELQKKKLQEEIIVTQQKHEQFQNEKTKIQQETQDMKSTFIDLIENEVSTLKDLYHDKLNYFDIVSQQSQQIVDKIQNESQLKSLVLQDSFQDISQIPQNQSKPSLLPQNSNMSLKDIGQKSMSSLFFNDNSLVSDNIYGTLNYQSINSNRNSFNNIPPIKGFDQINKLSKEFQSSRNLRSFQKKDEKDKFQQQLNKNWNKIIKFLQKIVGSIFKTSFVLSNCLSRIVQNYKGKPIYSKLKTNVLNFLKESVSRHKTSLKKLKGYQKLNKISFEALLSCFQKVNEIVEKESNNQEQLNSNIKSVLKSKS